MLKIPKALHHVNFIGIRRDLKLIGLHGSSKYNKKLIPQAPEIRNTTTTLNLSAAGDPPPKATSVHVSTLFRVYCLCLSCWGHKFTSSERSAWQFCQKWRIVIRQFKMGLQRFAGERWVSLSPDASLADSLLLRFSILGPLLLYFPHSNLIDNDATVEGFYFLLKKIRTFTVWCFFLCFISTG